tara:strand:+ start:3533 stop:3886 length:354 start_codon:yes stop_codon:yes gene_type:complete
MTREEYLKFCKVCVNRKIDLQKGLVCSLTNEIASFDQVCSQNEIDIVQQNKLAARGYQESTKETNTGFFGSWKSALLLCAFGFIKAVSKGFDSKSGIIFLAIGIGWLVIALVRNEKK